MYCGNWVPGGTGGKRRHYEAPKDEPREVAQELLEGYADAEQEPDAAPAAGRVAAVGAVLEARCGLPAEKRNDLLREE